MIRNIKILVLEDDLETIEKIFFVLRQIEEEKKVALGVTVISDYFQTEEFINKNPQIKFDILLLDRDCFLGGSFHTVDLKNFNKDKVISISSVPEYNLKAQEMGIKRIVLKDYFDLDSFSEKVKKEIVSLI
ncbi:MAG: hypothetical protein ABIJ05_03180 [Patescibacteria group bacterium]